MRAGQRWRWLGHPVFLGAVVLLVVNDHVLKARHGTWWTGKLSDVAGVAVVGIAASVLVGPRRGLLATGLAFAALKTVPGVAEAVAPVLGGVTRRDATDVLALVVLVPLWRWLVGSEPATRPAARRSQSPEFPARAPRATAALAVVGATVAVFACTATSCEPVDGVVQIVVDGGTVYAGIDRYHGPTSWARSDDGGRTWKRADRPSVVPAPPASPIAAPGAPPMPDLPIGPTRACLDDGTCLELDPQVRIRSVDADGTERQELDLGRWDLDSCGGLAGALESIGIVEVDGAEVAVAALGSGGVVVRGPDGEWSRHDVLDIEDPPRRVDRAPLGWGIIANALVAVGVGVVGRVRRWPSWVAGMIASALIAVAFFFVALSLIMMPRAALSAVGVLVITLANAGVGLAVGRSTVFDRRPPPPPGPWGSLPPPGSWSAFPPPPGSGGGTGDTSGRWQPPPPPPSGSAF